MAAPPAPVVSSKQALALLRRHGLMTLTGGRFPGGRIAMHADAKAPRTRAERAPFAPDGKLWLALREGNAVLQLDPKAGTLRRVAGTGKSGFTGNGGPAREATLAGPKCVSLDAAGNVWLADTESHSIRMVNMKTGNLELIAGLNQKGDGPDGDPLGCKMARPHGVFCDADGTVFIGDSESHRVRLLKRK